MTQLDIKSAVLNEISKHLNIENVYVFLFGSRACGDYSSVSDYDIGICGEEPIPLSVRSMIKGDLEDNYPIPFNFDIVDFSKTTDDFNKIALDNIEIWNKPRKALKLTLSF